MKFSYHTFFIMQDGTIKCCGHNGYGQLGLGFATPDPYAYPTVTDLPLTGVKNIVCSYGHTFFIMEDGTVKCCGHNLSGQLGLGHRNSPVSTVTELPLTGVKNIVCGGAHTFFIMENGTIKCCGSNSYGQLGLGHTKDPVFTVTDLPLTGVKDIVCGYFYTFFIMQDGTIKCCGDNRYGQLGIGHTNTLVSTVTDLPLTEVKDIVCSYDYTFFIMQDGTIKCCGNNGYGQLGLGHTNTGSTVTDLPLTGVKDIVCGDQHTFFIMNDNTVKGCGDNRYGQLGIGNTDYEPSPVTVPGISNFDRFPHSGAKQDREAPSVPVATVITENSITWVSDDGSIVVCNGEEKPSGSTWTGLIPGTTYTAYAYFPETDVYNRSPDSETASVTTLKFEQSAPSKPQAISVTENSITWISDGGSIIECNGEEKPSGSTWTGLEPDTTYTARAYFPETDIYYRSPYSEYGVAITLKPERLPPGAPIVSELTARTVVLTSSPGSIIVCNNQEKPSGSTWTWLTPGNVYEAYAYFPESQGETRSPNSEKTIFTTLQSSVDEEVIITGIMTDGTPASTDLLRNALILSASNDCVEISNNQILAVKSGTCRITFSVEGKITYMDIIIP